MKDNIMSMWSINIKSEPGGRLIKQKATYVFMDFFQQWGVNYLEAYYLVFKWIYVRSMLTLISFKALYTKYVDFLLAYI